jgi:hypothetical protein
MPKLHPFEHKVGLVDRFHKPVPKPVFYWNRFHSRTGFLKPVLIKKQF